jgi:hypothetical protein
MKSMVPLRLAGIGRDVAFRGNPYLGGLTPILLLHLGLLPLNPRQMRQALRSLRAGGRRARRKPAINALAAWSAR